VSEAYGVWAKEVMGRKYMGVTARRSHRREGPHRPRLRGVKPVGHARRSRRDRSRAEVADHRKRLRLSGSVEWTAPTHAGNCLGHGQKTDRNGADGNVGVNASTNLRSLSVHSVFCPRPKSVGVPSGLS